MVPPDTLGIVLNFDDDLTELLRRGHDDGTVRYRARAGQSIKDVVESLGVPHTEVGRIERCGIPEDFAMLPGEGDVVCLCGHALPLDVTETTLLRPGLPSLRFLLDDNVAGVALLLRALGLDARWDRGADDAALARLAQVEERVLLSRDRGLLKRSMVIHGRLLRTQQPDAQLAELVRAYGLQHMPEILGRCLRCNVPTRHVEKRAVIHRLEPKTKKYFNEFRECPSCGGVFWKGSHYAHLINRLRKAGVEIA